MTITDLYESLILTETDMKPHLPKLRELANGKRCVEFGVRRGVSTCALLAGNPASLHSYDINPHPDIDSLADVAWYCGIDFAFHIEDLAKVKEIDPADFGFIDAMHNERDVTHYIRLMVAAGVTTLAFHDTESFRYIGDVAGTDGVMSAIENFLKENKGWKLTYDTPEYSGFSVIERA